MYNLLSEQNKLCHPTYDSAQCFQDALAYLASAISYKGKMFMTLTPGEIGQPSNIGVSLVRRIGIKDKEI
jgi:hypothetical protein